MTADPAGDRTTDSVNGAGSKAKTRTPFEQLKDSSDLAYLLYRRNKNQHRRSHWWKHFNIFRRQLSLLVAELSSVKQQQQNPQQLSGDRSQDGATKMVQLNSKAEARIDAWVEFYVAKWFSAFSQILAERRFAALGLTMLALFARVCQLTGVTDKLVEQGEEDLVEQMQNRTVTTIENSQEDFKNMVDDDIGVAVVRTETQGKAPQSPQNKPSSTVKSKPVRRRKGGNAIDDIFGGLG